VVIPTPAALGWIDVEALQKLTGRPVTAAGRGPGEPKTLPALTAVLVVPATFNTVNKLAAGINDNAAVGAVNEALGARIPVVIVPYVKGALAAHPAFGRSIEFLDRAGVSFMDGQQIGSGSSDTPFNWALVVRTLASHERS
jgi:phosphopantothenoylcysteine synthetase/decarboxylase